MSAITGIFVSLQVGPAAYDGTDDHLYLGVPGTVGGREFALDVRGFDDFEPGTTVTYSIGPGAAVFAGREPVTAAAQLAAMTICQPNVTGVYLRKQGTNTHDGDDLLELHDAFVYLIAQGTPTRVFTMTGEARLGNEYGHVVHLGEVSHSGSFRNARFNVDGDADCTAA